MRILIAECVVVALVVLSVDGRNVGERKTIIKNEFFDKTIPDVEVSLSTADFENANRLAIEKTSTTAEDNSPMENPNLFEGDIAIKGFNKTTLLRFIRQENFNETRMRNAIRGNNFRWPGAVIPYTISDQYSAQARSVIAYAINQFTLKTCIKIIPRTTQRDYVHIVPDTGCYSYIGKIGGRQILSLGDGCVDRGIVLHELMHAVGFFHEQSRPDRDLYVEILLQNVADGFASEFEKYSLNRVDLLRQPYDYNSIMHYDSRAFSKNGKETIRPVALARARGVRLLRGNDFSAVDVKELNIIAQCPNRR